MLSPNIDGPKCMFFNFCLNAFPYIRAPKCDKLLLNMFYFGFVRAVLLAILYISFALFMNIISSNVKKLELLRASFSVT